MVAGACFQRYTRRAAAFLRRYRSACAPLDFLLGFFFQVRAAAMPTAARVIKLEAGRPSNSEYAGLDFPQAGISLACRHRVAR
jgi:hypothetical protein